MMDENDLAVSIYQLLRELRFNRFWAKFHADNANAKAPSVEAREAAEQSLKFRDKANAMLPQIVKAAEQLCDALGAGRPPSLDEFVVYMRQCDEEKALAVWDYVQVDLRRLDSRYTKDQGAVWLGNGRIRIDGEPHRISPDNPVKFIEQLLDLGGAANSADMHNAGVTNASKASQYLLGWKGGILKPYLTTPERKRNAGWSTTIRDGRSESS